MSCKYSALIILCFLLLLSGCDDKSSTNSELSSTYLDDFSGLLCPIHFEEAKFYTPNFPFWFNDSLIQKHGISKISIEKKQVLQDSTMSSKDAYGFYFNKTGQVQKLLHSIFYDDKTISEEEFLLTEITPFYYRAVSNLIDDLNYQLFEMTTNSDSLLVFQQTNSDLRQVYVRNHADQNVHFIDKLSEGTDNTLWLYGDPRLYKAKFFLENMVNKPEETNLEFLNDNRLIEKTIRSRGFITKRKYNYDTTNYWIGYQDSVFSSTGSFVKLQEMKVSLSNQSIPEKITMYNGLETNSLSAVLILDFQYEFYEPQP